MNSKPEKKINRNYLQNINHKFIIGAWIVSIINSVYLLSIEVIFYYHNFIDLVLIRTTLGAILIILNMLVLFVETKFSKIGDLPKQCKYLTHRLQIQLILTGFFYLFFYSFQYLFELFR